MQRINRKLRKDGEVLRKCRSNSRDWPSLGDFYAVDFTNNAVTAQHVDPEQWGRELGVL